MISEARYRYSAEYIPDLRVFRDRVRAKTIIPYQVEWQPGPPGHQICWLTCPYCYGASAAQVPDRLPVDRAIQVLHEVADGGVRKIIFAGYATDPLHSKDITALVSAATSRKLITGFNTKALHVPEKLLAVLDILAVPESYVSVSVDAGSNTVYNLVHGVTSPEAKLYTRVMENIHSLCDTGIEVAATYLVNRFNATEAELAQFVSDSMRAGVDMIRFAFAQSPRGAEELSTVPTLDECRLFQARLLPLVEKWDSPECRVLLADVDREYNLFRKARTFPCVARWVYPTVGYDGWLYPCSQTAAPNFRSIALGNLATRSFWDLYYTYNSCDLGWEMDRAHRKMEQDDCRCDRKEHLVNLSVAQSGELAPWYTLEST